MIKKVLVLILLVFSFSIAEENPKAVINLTTGDLKKFKMYLLSGLANSAEYYKNQLRDLKVVVIIHGRCVQILYKRLTKFTIQR